MYLLKIHGAGSIGNHIAHAGRRLHWDVTVCDVSDAALQRMREEIYPSRYGAWDPAIQLVNSAAAPRGGFDVIHIGTPPDVHVALALEALAEAPRAIVVEKPLCPPSLAGAADLHARTRASSTKVFVGYDHVVGKAARQVAALVSEGRIGAVRTIDVEFREAWDGILRAHPWLRGPEDTYLGFWERGGGASGEHSHAANLWQHFARVGGAGRIVEVDAMLGYGPDGRSAYDDVCLLHVRTESGLIGRIVQDAVTRPPLKRARIQGERGAIEWVGGYTAEADAVRWLRPDAPEELSVIPKRRPDDFIQELEHVAAQLEGTDARDDIGLEAGLDTMLVLAAAHRSQRQRCRVEIDYNKGYVADALRPSRG
jgi:predicted dehydrogenase